jgi:hypothetical protein
MGCAYPIHSSRRAHVPPSRPLYLLSRLFALLGTQDCPAYAEALKGKGKREFICVDQTDLETVREREEVARLAKALRAQGGARARYQNAPEEPG